MRPYTNKPLASAMARAGLRSVDLARLVGRDPSTIWRWRSNASPVPEYVWTILRLQQRVRNLPPRLVLSTLLVERFEQRGSRFIDSRRLLKNTLRDSHVNLGVG